MKKEEILMEMGYFLMDNNLTRAFDEMLSNKGYNDEEIKEIWDKIENGHE